MRRGNNDVVSSKVTNLHIFVNILEKLVGHINIPGGVYTFYIFVRT